MSIWVLGDTPTRQIFVSRIGVISQGTYESDSNYSRFSGSLRDVKEYVKACKGNVTNSKVM